VSQERIEHAVAQCEISKMREKYGRFFRKGAVGDWTQELSDEIKELFCHFEPYPSQFAALGYIMDPNAPLISESTQGSVSDNPFDHLTHFDNGIPIPSLAIELYLSQAPVFARRWSPVERASSPGSFFNWLNAPTKDDPYRDTAAPIITNLAAYLYDMRQDLQAVFPDIYRQNRIDYAHWFAIHARDEYELDIAFALPILLSWTSHRNVLQPR
jgi:hypothetical protein